jgi:hypothetical protein
MHLVQILLPVHDNDKEPFPPEAYRRVRQELTEQFGGLTVYRRAPAEGLWKVNGDFTSRDDIVIFEVMARELDLIWWSKYRNELEERFRQDSIVIRSQQIRVL